MILGKWVCDKCGAESEFLYDPTPGENGSVNYPRAIRCNIAGPGGICDGFSRKQPREKANG